MDYKELTERKKKFDLSFKKVAETFKSAAKSKGAKVDRLQHYKMLSGIFEAEEKFFKQELKSSQKKLEQLLFDDELESIKGKEGNLILLEKDTFQIEDWDLFIKWAIKTKNLHLLQSKISTPAMREYLEDQLNALQDKTESQGKEFNLEKVDKNKLLPPGIHYTQWKESSLRKVSKK